VTPATVPDALDRAATFADAGVRLVDRHEVERFLSWSDLRERSRGVAAGLCARGVRPGDRVALVYPTGEGFLAAFFGILVAGATPVPLYPPVRLGRLDEYLDATARMLVEVEARCVLVDPRVRRLIGSAVARARPVAGAPTIDELASGQPEPVAIRTTDLALVQFSSGSTRSPKPVALSHGAVLAQARILNGLWPPANGVRHSGVSWLPLYHDMGLIGCILPALEMPSVLTLLAPETFLARPASWLRAISRHRATISPAPNFAFAYAAERVRDDDMDGVDLSCWRVAPNGAEPISADAIRAFASRFARWGLRAETVTPVYGLSEAALAVTFSDIERPPRIRTFDREELWDRGRARPTANGVELVSVGRPVPGFDVRIVADDGTDVEEGRVGRILARGPSLMDGYLGNPADSAAVLHEGWLDTGDLGFVLDGELFLSGRKKDLVILRGRNHDPAIFEEAAGTVEGVRKGRVVAAGRSVEGSSTEQLWLFVEPRAGLPRKGREALPDLCRAAIVASTGIAVDRVVVVDPGALPRTSSGKLRRSETVRRFEAGTLVAPGAASGLRVAGEILRSLAVRDRSADR